MFIYLTSLLIVIADQASKYLALKYLSFSEPLPVIQNIFYLTLVKNKGIAFGLFKTDSHLLIIMLSFVLFVMIILARTLNKQEALIKLAFAFILGGALSNLIDRVRFGYVIDYLDFRIWPVFNIADSFITVGTFLIILRIIARK